MFFIVIVMTAVNEICLDDHEETSLSSHFKFLLLLSE